jgi:formylglycine-generating enzyme required for sulfatase activity
MEIWLRQEGAEYGPYTLAQVREFVASGESVLEDEAWFEGCEDYVTVGDIPNFTSPRKIALEEPRKKNPIVIASIIVSSVLLFAGLVVGGFYIMNSSSGGEGGTVDELVEAPNGPFKGESFSIPDLNMDMLWCKPGTFMMGSPEDETGRRDDETQHEVTLTQGFYLGKYEVTQAQREKVVGTIGGATLTEAQKQAAWTLERSIFKVADQTDELAVKMAISNGDFQGAADARDRRLKREDEEWERVRRYELSGRWPKDLGLTNAEIDEKSAMEKVSWDDAMKFCEKLTQMEKEAGRLPEGWVYTLPTEAQWEYACRAGTVTAYSFGDEITPKQANFNRNVGKTTDGLQYPANAWGFHDMHGNVWEWCSDWYGDYPSGSVSDPVGPSDGSRRVYRGGGWYGSGGIMRSAARYRNSPDYRVLGLRFRLSLQRETEKTE